MSKSIITDSGENSNETIDILNGLSEEKKKKLISISSNFIQCCSTPPPAKKPHKSGFGQSYHHSAYFGGNDCYTAGDCDSSTTSSSSNHSCRYSNCSSSGSCSSSNSSGCSSSSEEDSCGPPPIWKTEKAIPKKDCSDVPKEMSKLIDITQLSCPKKETQHNLNVKVQFGYKLPKINHPICCRCRKMLASITCPACGVVYYCSNKCMMAANQPTQTYPHNMFCGYLKEIKQRTITKVRLVKYYQLVQQRFWLVVYKNSQLKQPMKITQIRPASQGEHVSQEKYSTLLRLYSGNFDHDAFIGSSFENNHGRSLMYNLEEEISKKGSDDQVYNDHVRKIKTTFNKGTISCASGSKKEKCPKYYPQSGCNPFEEKMVCNYLHPVRGWTEKKIYWEEVVYRALMYREKKY
jgi:hypothetical protein